MSNILDRNQFIDFVKKIEPNPGLDCDHLYELYETVYQGIEEINDVNQFNKQFDINSFDIIFYLLGEYFYSTRGLGKENIAKFNENENISESMCSVIADKYISLSAYNRKESKLTNKYFPLISSLDLYLNLMSNIISLYNRNEPKKTLIVDLLNKSISIARCILNLLCDGYETEALAMWRTLHECECTLILLDKYRDSAINAYLKHMEFGLAYKNAINDKEKQDKLFYQMKDEMAELGLKSKDIKKYIEYGWMLSIDEAKNDPNFKLNFRDGLETLAGLHQYSNIYMTSSEILHSTPLLIYSNKRYFYYTTLLSLYESFFRIEKVFTTLFFQSVPEEAKKRYLEMRNLYYQQLINIHQREMMVFKQTNKKKEA